MKIVRWAAAAVTALMCLMNFGAVFEASSAPVAVVDAVLCAAGIVASVGLLRRASWGRPAVLVVGALNLVGGVIALVTEVEGAPIGIAVSGIALVLGALVRDTLAPALRSSAT